MELTLPYNWVPRDYQMPAWLALEEGIQKSIRGELGVNRALMFWHRRAHGVDTARRRARQADLRQDPQRCCMNGLDASRRNGAITPALYPRPDRRRSVQPDGGSDRCSCWSWWRSSPC